MRRREFIPLLGGAAAWPLAARAQQGNRVRRIGMLISGRDENDPQTKANLSALTQALADLGWTDGHNVRMDLRWGGADVNRIRALAGELVGLQPDIIVTSGTPPTVALQRETRTIPIVFVNVADPVGIEHDCGPLEPWGKSNSSHLPPSEGSKAANLVTFPPRRSSRGTMPVATGSPPVRKTIGIVRVSR